MNLQTAPFLPHPPDWCSDSKDSQLESWPLYSLGLVSLPKGVQAAVLRSWYYTGSSNKDGTAFVVHVGGRVKPDTVRSATIARMQTGYRELVELPIAKDPRLVWEVRALQITPIHLGAMWLHSLSGQPDGVIPFATFSPYLKLGEMYSLERFMLSANDLARKWIKPPAV
jgi:hypothetical protein